MDSNMINMIKDIAPVAVNIVKDVFTDKPKVSANMDVNKNSFDIVEGKKDININIHLHFNVYVNSTDKLLETGKIMNGMY